MKNPKIALSPRVAYVPRFFGSTRAFFEKVGDFLKKSVLFQNSKSCNFLVAIFREGEKVATFSTLIFSNVYF
jgi:hypothetical protein